MTRFLPARPLHPWFRSWTLLALAWAAAVLSSRILEYEIPAAPHQTISLEFSCNFYVKDAKERRGEDRLSMIVSMEEK